jgi:stage III sporulation protein SpoIIIAA
VGTQDLFHMQLVKKSRGSSALLYVRARGIMPVGENGGRIIDDFRSALTADDTQQAHQKDLFRVELEQLLCKLPAVVRKALEDAVSESSSEIMSMDNLAEIYIQNGRVPEAIFADHEGRKLRHPITRGCCDENDVAMFRETFDGDQAIFTTHRKGIAGTLHRLSIIVHPTIACSITKQPRIIGVTARVGRAIHGILQKMAPHVLFSTESLLLIGKPGVGKTTVLREFARMLSENQELIVVVVDKTNEIGGDGLIPHQSIGSARWMPVGKRGLQAEVLREAVENQTPDVVICDEISTKEEVEAARGMGQRGVRIIASVHGSTLAEISHCNERGMLVGGQTSVTLTDTAAAARSDKMKNVLKRAREPVFGAALELHERHHWVYHGRVKHVLDHYYANELSCAESLTPGVRREVALVPDLDSFVYCSQCVRWPITSQTCSPCREHAKMVTAPRAVEIALLSRNNTQRRTKAGFDF